MREEPFRLYLEGLLSGSSPAGYLSYARRLEAKLGRSLDECDLSEGGLAGIRRELSAQFVPEKYISNLLSVARRYRDFITRSVDGSALGRLGPARNEARRLRSSQAVPVAEDILAAAVDHLRVDLVALVARCAIWSHPKTFDALRQNDPNAAWFPNTRRVRIGEARGAIVQGEKLDDNSHANKAIKLAVFGTYRVPGFKACHVWPRSCYDARYHNSVGNLVLVPAPIVSLTDHSKDVEAALKYRAFELFDCFPAEQGPPQRPERYPPPELWLPAPEPSEAAEAALRRRLAKTS